jgi:hypothetical protein
MSGDRTIPTEKTIPEQNTKSAIEKQVYNQTIQLLHDTTYSTTKQ